MKVRFKCICMHVKEVKKPAEEGLGRIKCRAKDVTVLTSPDQRVFLSFSVLPSLGGQEKDVTRKMAHETVVANSRAICNIPRVSICM